MRADSTQMVTMSPIGYISRCASHYISKGNRMSSEISRTTDAAGIRATGAIGMNNLPRVLGVVGWSGAGKTTLIEALLPLLQARGIQCAVIKHAHHAVDIDSPGKDSYRFREAGAVPVLLASSKRWAMMVETPQQQEPELKTLLAQVATLQPDLVLVEGFKHESMPKLEVYRYKNGKPLLAPHDASVHAIATPQAELPESALMEHTRLKDVTLLDLSEPENVAGWIEDVYQHPEGEWPERCVNRHSPDASDEP
ncbi:hypothetical protein LMG33818_000490 [Halomonadaceae bacterium LMG 33818]|uniref:molybdopterin-guanine dinucleotide biosynthesis protein B n=1 Tax=Cernens ardua TaxID=3402176 RepID=UPI003EDC35A8